MQPLRLLLVRIMGPLFGLLEKPTCIPRKMEVSTNDASKIIPGWENGTKVDIMDSFMIRHIICGNRGDP